MKLIYILGLLLLVACAIPSSATGTTVYSYGSTNAYIENYGNGTVGILNTTTDIITGNIVVGGLPIAIDISRDGTRVYIVNINDMNVTVIDTATNTIIQTIGVNISSCNSGAVSPDGSRVYISNSNDAHIAVIDTTTASQISTITLNNPTNSCTCVLVSHDGRMLYVTNTDNVDNDLVSVVNISTGNTIADIHVGVTPDEMVMTLDGSKLYVTNSYGESISVINTLNNSVINTINTDHNPINMAINPAGTKIYATNDYDSIYVIDVATDTVTNTITNAGFNNLNGISFTSDGAKAYVASYNTNTVLVMNTTTETVINTITGFKRPTSLGKFINSFISPVASFTSNVASGSIPLAVTFTDHSTGLPTSWDWDFGDGSVHGTTQSPTHTYSSEGIYTVVLNASNLAGYSINTQTDYLTATQGSSDDAVTMTLLQSNMDQPLLIASTTSSSINVTQSQTYSSLLRSVTNSINNGYTLLSLGVIALAAAAILRYLGYL